MNSIEPNPDSYATQNSEIHIPVAKLLQHWPQVDVGSNRQGPAAVPAWCTKIFVLSFQKNRKERKERNVLL